MLAHEPVPETYRQNLWDVRKTQNQSYLDFARENGILFDQWCTACKESNLATVHELMLVKAKRFTSQCDHFATHGFFLTHNSNFIKPAFPSDANGKADDKQATQ